MKNITPVLFAAAAALCSCTFERDIQVTPMDVQLVKIDTVRRQSTRDELLLTWRGEDNVQFISFQPLGAYSVGYHMKVLVRR